MIGIPLIREISFIAVIALRGRENLSSRDRKAYYEKWFLAEPWSMGRIWTYRMGWGREGIQAEEWLEWTPVTLKSPWPPAWVVLLVWRFFFFIFFIFIFFLWSCLSCKNGPLSHHAVDLSMRDSWPLLVITLAAHYAKRPSKILLLECEVHFKALFCWPSLGRCHVQSSLLSYWVSPALLWDQRKGEFHHIREKKVHCL